MQAIENFFNRIADMDWTWWPLLSLRPHQEQKIDNTRLKIYSVPINAIYLVAVSWVFIFLFCKFVLAYFWNRRAERFKK
jgi:hypothetical protein